MPVRCDGKKIMLMAKAEYRSLRWYRTLVLHGQVIGLIAANIIGRMSRQTREQPVEATKHLLVLV